MFQGNIMNGNIASEKDHEKQNEESDETSKIRDNSTRKACSFQLTLAALMVRSQRHNMYNTEFFSNHWFLLRSFSEIDCNTAHKTVVPPCLN